MRSLAPRGSLFSSSVVPREQTRSAMLTANFALCPTTTRRRRLAPSPASASASASASAPAGPSGRHHHRRHIASLDAINNTTKWTVSAATACVLLRNSADPSTRFAVIGSVAAAFLTKVLKRLVNEARPHSARKRDPGMPSSHAQSLAFLSTSAARAILVSNSKRGGGEAIVSLLPPPVATAALVLAAAVLLATLRVVLGYHTWPQVVAGGVLGCLLALGWAELGARVVVPLCCSSARDGAVASAALACATGLAVAVFAFVTVRIWWKEGNGKLVEGGEREAGGEGLSDKSTERGRREREREG